MKRIILFLFFLALGLLSISCGKISIGGSSDNKNAADLQTNAPKPSVPFTQQEYDALAGYYSGTVGRTLLVYHYKNDKTYESYDCGLDDATLTLSPNSGGTHEGYDHDKIYMKTTSGSTFLIQWDKKDTFTLTDSGSTFRRTKPENACPGSAGLTSKGKDYETLEGFWKMTNGSAARFYLRRDGENKKYYCNPNNKLTIGDVALYTITGDKVDVTKKMMWHNVFTWDDNGTPNDGSDDKLDNGMSEVLVKVPAGADACS